MRKFSLFFAILISAILLLCSATFCDNRYQYLGTSKYSKFYIDTDSIVKEYETLPIFKFWLMDIVSLAGRNQYILMQKNYERKNLLQNLSYVLYCYEIDLSNNTCRILETFYFSSEGMLLHDNLYSDWVNIPPDSFMELARDVVKRIIQDKSFRENEDNIKKYSYIFVSLLAGIIISVSLVMFIKKFMPDNPDNSNEENTNSSSKTEDNSIDAILVDENEVRKSINEYTRKTFLSKITLIEKIFICLGLLNIVLLSLTLSGFIQPLEYMSVQESREIIKSSVLALCAWFSVRYSFHMASQVTGKGFAKFLKFIGIFICLFIFWAHGKGYF